MERMVIALMKKEQIIGWSRESKKEPKQESVKIGKPGTLETGERARPCKTLWADFILIAMGKFQQGKLGSTRPMLISLDLVLQCQPSDLTGVKL